MAGANNKKITASNNSTIQRIRYGFIASNIIYILSFFIFSSSRSWTRSFLYIGTESIGIMLWQQLELMLKRGEDLNAVGGLTSSYYDIIYITWIVHIGSALITRYFWYLYLSIPIYGIYKIVSFILPYVMPLITGGGGGSASTVPEKAVRRKATKVEEDYPVENVEPLSKRQEKLKKRSEKGPLKMNPRI